MLIRRFEDGNKIDGNIIIVTTIGRPIIVGVMNEANRFSFILVLKGFLLLWLLMILVMVEVERFGRRFLVEIRRIG